MLPNEFIVKAIAKAIALDELLSAVRLGFGLYVVFVHEILKTNNFVGILCGFA